MINLENNRLIGHIPNNFALLSDNKLFLQGNIFWCPRPNWKSVATFSCKEVNLYSITPNSGSQIGGYTVNITGNNFLSEIEIFVVFDDIKTNNILYMDNNLIQVVVPPHPSKTVAVKIASASNEFIGIDYATFTYLKECPQGTFREKEACSLCPQGAFCKGGGEKPTPLFGYKESENVPLLFYQCFTKSDCLEDNTCSDGYKGSRCHACDTSTGFALIGKKCQKCFLPKVVEYLIALVAIILFVLYLNYSVESNKSLGILLSHIQILGLFSTYPFQSNLIASTVLETVTSSVSTYDFLFPCSLALGSTFASRHGLFLYPLILILVLTIILITFKIYFPKADLKVQKMVDKTISSILRVCSIFYIVISQTTISYFVCSADVIASIACYVIGIPILVTFICFTFKYHADNPRVVARYQNIAAKYRHNAWMWPTIEMLFKLLLTFFPVLLKSDPIILGLSCVVLLYLFANLCHYANPYVYHFPSYASTVSLYSLCYILLGLVIVHIQGPNAQGSQIIVNISACLIVLSTLFIAFMSACEFLNCSYHNKSIPPGVMEFLKMRSKFLYEFITLKSDYDHGAMAKDIRNNVKISSSGIIRSITKLK
ncbi:hypothetical protein ROZALSC1DRAFT_21340 [Rozella allomycis CSF55]|uniref:IPT/TIG domain-containing protein n=1 Tax=Rozella allomycis (strain CSF55) TaxID=988480 RepID=A0A4P9YLH9_ROZAC|nr:hypothetical protein ROZALSC1DRAFT_21340 [Rozella allomycis CSF55]